MWDSRLNSRSSSSSSKPGGGINPSEFRAGARADVCKGTGGCVDADDWDEIEVCVCTSGCIETADCIDIDGCIGVDGRDGTISAVGVILPP